MFFKNQSIRKRMVVSCLIVTLIPLLILELYFSVLIQRKTYQSIVDSAGNNADRLAFNYQNQFDIMEQIALSLADFSPLEEYLHLEFADKGEAFEYYTRNIHPMLKNYNRLYPGVQVRIYHSQEEIPNFAFELNNDWIGFAREHDLEKLNLKEHGVWVWSDIHYNMYRSVYSYYQGVREGGWPYEALYFITIHMNEEFLYALIENEAVENQVIFVTDKAGNILTSNYRELVGETLADIPVSEDLDLMELEDYERITMEEREYIFSRRETEELNIFCLLDYDAVYSSQQFSAVTLVAVGACLFMLSCALIFYISKEITEGIKSLQQKMLNIDRGSIRALAAYDLGRSSKDEVKQLEIVFVSMMGQIDILLDNVQMQERRLKDETIARQQAEIRALQHQIDPHYLFNTLEAIRMNLVMKEERQTAEIVKLFAESFRRYVDMRDEYVPLFEEVEFIRKYIRIQNYRLNDKIEFVCIVEERLLRYRVMKLLLQPLVENAVCHGVEQREDGGRIILQMKKTKENFEILVEDNGVGMKARELEHLRRMVCSNQPGASVGLKNIYQRVRLIYGELAGMTIDSTEGVGTRVTLTLPLKRLEEFTCSKS